MPSCFICGRSNTAKSKSKNISFHRFPSKECILRKWHGFIISHNLAVDKINKNSLICSLHFVPESFNVYNKVRYLQKHALPTIKICRVKWAKTEYPELEEKLSLAEHQSSTPELHMERTLVKVPNISELSKEFVPLSNLDQTIASSSSDTFSPCTSTVKEKFESSFSDVTSASPDDTTNFSYLEHKIRKLTNEMRIKNKKIKGLQQIVRRQNKQIDSLSETIFKLKNRANPETPCKMKSTSKNV